jgi:hypothetical protein
MYLNALKVHCYPHPCMLHALSEQMNIQAEDMAALQIPKLFGGDLQIHVCTAVYYYNATSSQS